MLDWVIKGGNTCNGILIKRAGSDKVFEIIGEIQGVCGDNSKDEAYSFIDENPLVNQENFYQLTLGFTGYSDIISIPFYQFNGYPYIKTNNNLRFDSQYIGSELSIYSKSGQLIYQNTINELLALPNSLSGIFIIYIKNKNSDKQYKKVVYF